MLPDMCITSIYYHRDNAFGPVIERTHTHRCGCVTVTDASGNVLAGRACLAPEHRADIEEPDRDPITGGLYCPECNGFDGSHVGSCSRLG